MAQISIWSCFAVTLAENVQNTKPVHCTGFVFCKFHAAVYCKEDDLDQQCGSRHYTCINELCTVCYDIKPVRKEEGKFYWKIPLCDDDATREK